MLFGPHPGCGSVLEPAPVRQSEVPLVSLSRPWPPRSCGWWSVQDQDSWGREGAARTASEGRRAPHTGSLLLPRLGRHRQIRTANHQAEFNRQIKSPILQICLSGLYNLQIKPSILITQTWKHSLYILAVFLFFYYDCFISGQWITFKR